MAKISAIILAAGKGTRMKSPLPKVLHPVAGRPIITYIIEALKGVEVDSIRAVVGYGENLLRQTLEPLGIQCSVQREQKGTGHAVQQADVGSLEDLILICNGDHPLVRSWHLKPLIEEFRLNQLDLAVVSAKVPRPGSMGRIVRDGGGELKAIVESKDASSETLKINEINTGFYLIKKETLTELLPKISSQNAQGEYYLTDLIELAVQSGKKIKALQGAAEIAFGVNQQKELALATKSVYRQKAYDLMDEGVVVVDPENVYIDPTAQIGPATVVYPGVVLQGSCSIGSFCVLEPNCFLTHSTIGDSVQVRAGSYLEEAKVESKSVIGPYARLRPKTEVGSECKVGNFVEIKKSKLDRGVKVSHLAYVGDAEVGENTNLGCGIITVNYAPDKKKYKTKIGKNVFIGSDCQLVAPVTIGDGALVAAGSTITKNVGDGDLAIGRSRQENKEGYASRFTGEK